MKIFLLITLLSTLLCTGAIAQQQPATTPQQQEAIDNAMKKMNQSLQNLNATLHTLDSLNIRVPDLRQYPEIEKQINITKKENDSTADIELESPDMNENNPNKGINGNDTGWTETKTITETTTTDDTKELKNIKTTFFGLDLGVNAYFDPNNSTAATGAYAPLALKLNKSINVNLHVVHQNINLINHILNLDYGLYFEIDNYRFSNLDQTLIPRADTVGFASVEKTGVPLKKNKLTCTYLTIPVAFNIETNPQHRGKSFSIMAGGFAGVLIGSHTKQVDVDGDKMKVSDNYNLNRFRYGLMARVGYGPINFYLNYALSKMFAGNVEPDLTPLSAGLGLWF